MVGTSLYEKLGKEEGVGKIIDYFYDQVLSDEAINEYFKDIDMDRVRSHQKKFISYALDGPEDYSGKSMTEAHEGMNLKPVHFDAFTKHFRDSLKHFDVDEEDIDKSINKVNQLKDDILYQ